MCFMLVKVLNRTQRPPQGTPSTTVLNAPGLLCLNLQLFGMTH